MRGQLDQSAQINLLSREMVLSTLASMRYDLYQPVDETTAREVALSSGAVLVVERTVVRADTAAALYALSATGNAVLTDSF